jgi:hypothetical protein
LRAATTRARNAPGVSRDSLIALLPAELLDYKV